MKEIEKIIQAYDRVDWSSEKVALGTVVQVEESAYRRIGARMFVSSNGYWTGGISGGCLEGDALKRARIAINNNQSSIVVYDTMDDDGHQIGVGLGCNGRIEVMFTPIHQNDEHNPIEFLRTITNTREINTIVQVLRSSIPSCSAGSFYPIAQMKDFTTDAGLGHTDILELTNEAENKRKSAVHQLANTKGESLDILIELIQPKIKLICCGDNYDVNAFIPIAKELGWEVHVAGKLRKLGKDIFELSESVCSYEEVSSIPLDAFTAVVLMSHDYKTDLSLIQHFLSTDVPYIGMLGPKKRMLKMQNELGDTGKYTDLETKVNLFAPVGLDIGAESPEEIALSIAAEILTTLRQRKGTSLRQRLGPIHERI